MDRDYHFDMMKVLSHHAGFSEQEAQTIAFACQYVDDANEFLAMQFDNLDELRRAAPDVDAVGLIKAGKLDRVCTGHDDAQSAGGALITAQMLTYMPFHFIPRDAKGSKTRGGKTDMRFAPDCTIVHELITQAVEAVQHAAPAARTQALIRLGIALHSFIDSWAHKDFSGFYSKEDNQVVEFRLKDRDGTMKYIEIAGASQAVPATGHAKAHRYPDCSHHVWDYRNPVANEKFERDNPALYMVAAEKAYRHMLQASGGADHWDAIRPRVELVTRYWPEVPFDSKNPLSDATLAAKRGKYVEIFPEANLGPWGAGDAYDKHAWKRAAYRVLNGSTEVAVDDSRLVVTNEAGLAKSLFDMAVAEVGWDWKHHFKGDARWVWFQIEAKRQRDYVISRIDIDKGQLEASASIWGQLKDVAVNVAGPAQELRKKKAWINVELVNRTGWDLEWAGDAREDFDFADAVIEIDDSGGGIGGFFKSVAKGALKPLDALKSTVGSVGRGRYWENMEPRSTPAYGVSTFGLCERDYTLNVAGGVTRYRIKTDQGPVDITIAFSRPLGSDTRKLRASGGGSRRDAWGALGDAHIRPTANDVRLADGSVLRLAALPGAEAKVIIERVAVH